MSEAFFGIDLGTSNSSIAYVLADPRYKSQTTIHADVIKIPDATALRHTHERVPSVVGVNVRNRRTTRPLVGWEFLASFVRPRGGAAPLRQGHNFFRSVKSDMGTNRVYPHAVDPLLNTPVNVSAAIIRHLVDHARQERGLDPRRGQVVITVPASFSALARKDTLEAVSRAGVAQDRVTLLDEPVAALLDLLNSGDASRVLDERRFKTVLVFDYGGGTCDLTLVKARYHATHAMGVEVHPLAISQYRRLGGDDIDRAIMANVVWPQIERSIGPRSALKAAARAALEDTLIWTVARQLKEELCAAVVKRLAESRGNWTRAHAGRPVLISTPCRDFAELPARIPAVYSIAVDDLIRCMESFLAIPSGSLDEMKTTYPHSILVPVFETLEKAGLRPDALDALILHGGSSRNPFVRRMLEDALGRQGTLFGDVQVLQTPDLDTSVGRGAALAAYWKHARSITVVRPILAEALGVVARGDRYVQIADLGTPLPFPEGGVHSVPTEFYVQHDGQPELLVPIHTGTRDVIAGSIHVPLPGEVRQGTLVQMKLRIDENKRLDWWFSLDGQEPQPAPFIDDPCTAEVPSPEWQALLEHRLDMRRRLERRESITLELLVREAHLLYRAGKKEEAEAALDDLLTAETASSDREYAAAWNVRGLLLSARGDWKSAASAFDLAARLAPDRPIYCGNYGTALSETGKTEEGIAAIRRALGNDPDLVYLYEWLGDIYRDLGRETEAVREYRQGETRATAETTRYPQWREAWERRVRFHRKLGEYDRADEAEIELRRLMRDARYQGDSELMLGVLWDATQGE